MMWLKMFFLGWGFILIVCQKLHQQTVALNFEILENFWCMCIIVKKRAQLHMQVSMV